MERLTLNAAALIKAQENAANGGVGVGVGVGQGEVGEVRVGKNQLDSEASEDEKLYSMQSRHDYDPADAIDRGPENGGKSDHEVCVWGG